MSCIDALLLSFWPICRLIPWPPPQPMESHYLLPSLPIPLSFLLIIAIWSRRLRWLGLERARGGNGGGQRKPRVWHKNFVPFADIFSLGVTAVVCSTKMSKKISQPRNRQFWPQRNTTFKWTWTYTKRSRRRYLDWHRFASSQFDRQRDERKAIQVHWIRTFLLLDDVMHNKSTTTPFKVRTLSVCFGNWTCVWPRKKGERFPFECCPIQFLALRCPSTTTDHNLPNEREREKKRNS